MASRSRLSVAIITYNEENNIRDCIDSVTDLADEIVILDSFSTDNTETISKEYPKVSFHQHKFDGHVQQKNRALKLCQYDWILSLDADERVSPELAESIKKFLENTDDCVAAKFPRLTVHLKREIRHSGWYPNARYRLIKNGHAHWGGENPHDTLIIDGKGKMLKGDLIHYSFKDLSHQVQTINSFSSIVAYTRAHKGKKFRLARVLLKPASKFIEIYLIKKGFLDGLAGLIIAVSSSYSAFLKEAKLYELTRLGTERPSNLPPYYEKMDKS